MLSPGNSFPNFSLPNQDGKIMKLSDFAGHWLVVYFYPKDDTPGCTTQGRSFTASKADYDAAGIKIVGVSGLSADDGDSTGAGGVQAFLTKPYTAQELLFKLHAVLQNQ